MDFITFKKWIFAALVGAAGAGLSALASAVQAVDPATFSQNSTVIAIVGVVLAAAARGLGWLIAKIGA